MNIFMQISSRLSSSKKQGSFLFVMICLLVINSCFNKVVAQKKDSTKVKPDFELNMEGGGFYQAPLSSERVDMPEIINQQRSPTKINTGSDNPLLHGAYFINLKSKVNITDEVAFYADFIGEHRGFSYGVYDTRNMIVYPRAKFELDKADSLWNKPLRMFVSVGNKTKTRIHEGLTLYNIDAQGWDIWVQWGKFRLTYYQISDLQRWVGLNINDSYDTFVSMEELPLKGDWKIDNRFGVYNYESVFFFNGISGLKSSVGIHKKDFRFYMELANRFSDLIPDVKSKLGFVAGISWKSDMKNLSWSNKWEFRRYGNYFNQGYYSSFVSYRDPNRGNYSNTIGTKLYPLSSYYRPMSQWALFTEYRNLTISGYTWESVFKYQFNNGMFTKLNLDLNYLKPIGEEPFLYGLYTFEIGWEPIEDNHFSLGITNKGMNLDEHYPTFYYYQSPFFNVSLRRIVHW